MSRIAPFRTISFARFTLDKVGGGAQHGWMRRLTRAGIEVCGASSSPAPPRGATLLFGVPYPKVSPVRTST
jgi:hypothetical protein